MENYTVERIETAVGKPEPPVKNPKNKNPERKINAVFITVMLAVPILHWIVFWLIVNVNSILLAFKIPTGEWSMETLRVVIRQLGSMDSDLRVAIKNTLLYFSKDVLMLFFQMMIAYFFYKKILGYRIFRIVFYLPSIVSGVAVASMFSNFIAPSGPLGVILSKCGISAVPEFLANSDYATWTILFYTIWLGWGGNMLLFGGAFARIPTELIEAARLDGIGAFKEFIYLIIPLVWTTLSTLLILNMTGLFAASGPILLFTRGAYRTTTIGYWIFDKVAFVGLSAYNEVAAAGLIFSCIGVPVIMFFKWLVERIPTVEY
ncbi:MAG: sugar ABC transporter permease [Clostridia bacterium]|nr:sugar ABC transporter permease [Clostridia bacterium]